MFKFDINEDDEEAEHIVVSSSNIKALVYPYNLDQNTGDFIKSDLCDIENSSIVKRCKIIDSFSTRLHICLYAFNALES
jgi:hypothetical protein